MLSKFVQWQLLPSNTTTPNNKPFGNYYSFKVFLLQTSISNVGVYLLIFTHTPLQRSMPPTEGQMVTIFVSLSL